MRHTDRAASNVYGRRQIFTSLLVSIVLLLPPAAPQPAAYGASQENSASQTDTLRGTVQATTETSPGIHQAIFSTPQGKIFVNASDDMAVGDTLTGTVIVEPAGSNDAERERNRAQLEGLVVDIDGQKVPPAQERYKLSIPADAAKMALSVALKDAKGAELSRVEAPVSPEVRRQVPTDFAAPPYVQQGRFVRVRGPFDGDIAPTDQVKLGGQEARQLVEGPTGKVVHNPATTPGATRLEFSEQGRTRVSIVNNVSLRLSAQNYNLLKGETTTLRVEVRGLPPNMAEEVPVSLENLSPSALKLGGGDSQLIIIRQADVQAGGVYTTERLLTGISPGRFAITATVIVPERSLGRSAAVLPPDPNRGSPHPSPSPPRPGKERPGVPKVETGEREKIETSDPAAAVVNPSSALKSAAPSTAAALYDVGVIPGPNGCPCGTQLVTIHMDDEDYRNANKHEGWIGAISQDRNTTFRFCRVDGTKFSPPQNSAYAVLRLGQCPPFSQPFARYFDNEDDANTNTYSPADIGPNSVSNIFSSTLLNFCLFSSRYNPAGTPTSFPDLGAEYGVFAPKSFPGALGSGYVYTDDEDYFNQNAYDNGYQLLKPDTTYLISGASNTLLNLVKVKPAPPAGKLQSLKLSTNSVKGGANGKEPKLTVYLDGPVPPGSDAQKVSREALERLRGRPDLVELAEPLP